MKNFSNAVKTNLFCILFFCCLCSNTSAQYEVTGEITSGPDKLPGATLQLVNTPYATTTDQNGKFRFTLPPGNYTLKISYIGFKTYKAHFSVMNQDEYLNYTLQADAFELASLEVISTRITPNSAMSTSSLDSATIAKNNLGVELPYLLDQTPSVVVTSDAGNGVGYSGIRIRGSDPTRVNVSINGIPVNDAESQGVYWVDFPDLASSTNSIQIQRGAGTSVNGAGAFGGSVNIQTLNQKETAYAQISNSYGSFNTHKHTLNIGTGKMYKERYGNRNYFNFDSRLSWIASDGYIDRATSNMKSFYVSGGYFMRNSSIRLIAFSGNEKTYQAWGGVPKDSLTTNRTFNPYNYKNETDNYIQTNYQMIYNFRVNQKLQGNISLHYTKGAGYYEQYKYGQSFSDYGLGNIVIGTDTITETDLIRRKWLDNDFYGAVYTLQYRPSDKLEIVLGGGWNNYDGNHFGEIIWAQYALNSNINQEYYRDSAQKTDLNNFLKTNFWISKTINAFLDLQVRNVSYQFNGYDRDLNLINQKSKMLFFNPKFGLTGYLPKNQMVYSSISIANKEPNRDDFTSSSVNSRPEPEHMIDLEVGYKVSALRFLLTVNAYHMQYKDQLVLTGKINDVGSYTRQNIAESYRQGIELEAGTKIGEKLSVSLNATFSNNKILNYVEYIDNWDTYGQDSVIYAKTDIAFSPSVIVGGSLSYNLKYTTRNKKYKFRVPNKQLPVQNEFSISILPKYVGNQFIDNTSNTNRMLYGYFVTDARLLFTRKSNGSGRIVSLNFTLRNFLNTLYENNAWSYTYSSGGLQYTDLGYYPQAGINYLVGLTLGF